MQGQLFSQDFLQHGIRDTAPYRQLGDGALQAFRDALGAVFERLSADSTLNEAQTEQLVIEPVLRALGWSGDTMRQVNLSEVRREDVPDMLLFADAAAKSAALDEKKEDRRYRHGLAILEAKRWLRPLDRGDAADARDPGAPSSQMLRYLSRADVMSDRAVKWGILTNGGVWRLYWQDARSRAEEFFEIDVAALLGVPGVPPELDAPAREHGLASLLLLFGRDAFLVRPWDDARRSDARQVFSTRLDNFWRDLQGTFELIDEGDDAVAMPAYNGGLFDRARSPLLERTRVPDAVMAADHRPAAPKTRCAAGSTTATCRWRTSAASTSGCSNTRFSTRCRRPTTIASSTNSPASSRGRRASRARSRAVAARTTTWCG